MQCLIDNAVPNCNQRNKFMWNLSTLSIVIADLLRSPKTKVSCIIGNLKDIWLSKCTSVQISNITKACVQNVLRVLECKLEDVDATAWSHHRWTPGGCSHSSIRRNFSWSTSCIRLRYTLLQLPQNLACCELQRWFSASRTLSPAFRFN